MQIEANREEEKENKNVTLYCNKVATILYQCSVVMERQNKRERMRQGANRGKKDRIKTGKMKQFTGQCKNG